MRSSIACARCRRSKIKCVNAGIDTTCRACESTGRDCVYPTPAIGVGGAAKRDIAALGDGEDRNGDWDSPKRQRSRKAVGLSSSAGRDGSKASLDALDSSLLTVKVWEAVFDLFQSHFATLLPFLHPASFMGQIRQLETKVNVNSTINPSPNPQEPSRDQISNQSPPKAEPNPLIPLGVLALTARFHPQLVAYHSPSSPGNPSNPVLASEYYATALRSRLAGVDGASLAVQDLTRVQALLMLALHEWGMCRGKSAWLYVGMAIRLSQAMGLPFELENDVISRDAPPRSPALKIEADMFGVRRPTEQKEQTSDDEIAQETKRRTFWACFILDRCLSSGRYRPRMIRVKELGIQLPSDNAFAFGERVRTSRLNEPAARRPQSFGSQGVQIPSIRQSIGGFGDEKLVHNGSDGRPWSPVSRRKDSTEEEIERWEIGADESVLSRVIRITRVWGSIAKWSCAGGRRNEQLPPWHPDSRFYRLRSLLSEFRDGLSRNLQYSPRNTDTHIMYKNTLPPYTVMHVLYFLSVIVLHRSYVPFLPVRCSEPMGPLDEPVDKAGMPEAFWRDSARELFAAARHLMDLVVTCQERGVLVENPLVGFAIYNAAFIGIYAAHFPQMDLDGALSPVRDHARGQAQSRKALEILRETRPRLKMAAGWFRTLNRLHSYFQKVKRDFRRNSRKDMLPPDVLGDHGNGIRPVREGGPGAGLEEFKLLEKLFLEFGTIEDQLPEGSGNEEDGDRMTNVSDAGSNHVRSDPGDMGEGPLDGAGGRRESWVPVNSPGLPLPGPDGERRPSLPLPPTRALQSQSPYSLPAMQHHPDPHYPNVSPPSLPSIPHTSPYGIPATSAPAPGTRLQPIGSWAPSRSPVPPPPYTQSLPPISTAAPTHHLQMLPPPGSVGHPGASPPVTVDSMDMFNSLWATSLGGDDVLAFLDGSEYTQLPGTMPSAVGVPAGWLNTVWTEFTR
ncbi:fungal-specific transcription factor domain-containing protein [Aspergillus keveii]|uniref:Fungal-specific transcription factor domain-containing protein n=1 Tax=Aspergillus keveii TaxID=714993 RepID=A0ABR4GLU2_9EURO